MPTEHSTADLGEQLILVEALVAVLMESEEAEVVRLAVVALLGTSIGLTYLSAHPLAL